MKININISVRWVGFLPFAMSSMREMRVLGGMAAVTPSRKVPPPINSDINTYLFFFLKKKIPNININNATL